MAKKVDLKKLLENMTTQEKIGQLVQLNTIFYTKNESEITGPITEMGFSGKDLELIGSTLGVMCAEDMADIQKKHLEADHNNIPMIFMRDVIHGYRTIYPIPLAMAGTFDTELVEECAHMAAEEATADGVKVTFAPMVDYVRDARWGRIMESCGEDPYLSGVMGAAQVRAFQGGDLSKPGCIAACVKHFAAYGGVEAGRDYNTVELSEHVLREFYLPAYKACIDAGVKMLMPSFNNLNGVPSTANKWLMQDILRNEWGFDGLVISDYRAVEELVSHGVVADMKEAAALAFDNGCHIEMMSSAYFNNLATLINEGRVSIDQLDEAVMKVLEFKAELGLFDDPSGGGSAARAAEVCLTPQKRAIALRAAQESAVLLKNDGILPFNKDVKKIAVIGPYADNNGLLGAWECSGKRDECITVKTAVAELLPDAEIIYEKGCGMTYDDTDRRGIEAAAAAAKSADIVILCLGEPERYSGEAASRVDITLPGVQSELASAVIGANNNTAVLLFNGRPLALTELDKEARAILEMWYPGTEGGRAAANLIFGNANPCGKLTVSFPKSVGQCPIYYNYTNTGRPNFDDENRNPYASVYIDCGNLPLYFFGQGLSYTDFVYESMTLDKKVMSADSEITVKVKVRNDGKMAGKETVQMYLRDLVSSTVRPVQELIAFEKISLEPGESKTVCFKIKEPMLRFPDIRNKLVSEPGDFTVSVGYANHMAFTERFTLK